MISVIIPTFDEEKCIEKTLQSIGAENNIEIILVDSGSSDKTIEIAKKAGAKVLSSEKGRAIQMNAGAKSAKGDIFLFLHADTVLPEKWHNSIENALRSNKVAGGSFRFSTSVKGFIPTFITTMVNIRSALLKLPYGDQGIFIRKSIFEKLGGFTEIPLMEDVDMVRRIRHDWRLVILDETVVTSARRWESLGWIKTTLINQSLLYLYLFGVSPTKLAALYRTFR